MIFGVAVVATWHMYMWSVKYPIVAAGFGFVVGLLMGHFFWNQCLDVVIGHGCQP